MGFSRHRDLGRIFKRGGHNEGWGWVWVCKQLPRLSVLHHRVAYVWWHCEHDDMHRLNWKIEPVPPYCMLDTNLKTNERSSSLKAVGPYLSLVANRHDRPYYRNSSSCRHDFHQVFPLDHRWRAVNQLLHFLSFGNSGSLFHDTSPRCLSLKIRWRLHAVRVSNSLPSAMILTGCAKPDERTVTFCSSMTSAVTWCFRITVCLFFFGKEARTYILGS